MDVVVWTIGRYGATPDETLNLDFGVDFDVDVGIDMNVDVHLGRGGRIRFGAP